MTPAQSVTTFLQETWWLTAEMAPYLILGFCIAGLLRVFFTEDWIKRHLGQKGLYQIVKAVVIGIPLPLCSCGVIPVAAGIRRQGGQRGAVAAFTAATPQTGVDAIAATIGMLGWVFAAVRIVIAFLNGIIAGLVVERWGEKDTEIQPEDESTDDGCTDEAASCCGSGETEPEKDARACCGDKEPDSSSCCDSGETGSAAAANGRKFASGLKFGLITLPRELFGALVVGLLLAGAISTFVPEEFFHNIPGGQVGIYLGMTLLSLPLYVCSTGSIPMAYSFLQTGISPGAVLIFLIAGPASNTATVTSLWKIIGPKATIGYILSIIATCWVCAFLLDASGLSLLVQESAHHAAIDTNLFQQAMAVLLVVVLLYAKLEKVFRRS